jgi:enamine deaminase RidA (YjgF/YER057c/UK114 family)
MSVELVNPPSLGRPRGYSNGVVAEGRLLFVAGQIGWDAEGRFAEGFVAQFDRALGNVVQVIRAAGGEPESLCRLTIYVTDKRAYLAAVKDIGESWRGHLGRHYPAMTLVEVKALLEDRALCELEATAVLRTKKVRGP